MALSKWESDAKYMRRYEMQRIFRNTMSKIETCKNGIEGKKGW